MGRESCSLTTRFFTHPPNTHLLRVAWQEQLGFLIHEYLIHNFGPYPKQPLRTVKSSWCFGATGQRALLFWKPVLRRDLRAWVGVGTRWLWLHERSPLTPAFLHALGWMLNLEWVPAQLLAGASVLQGQLRFWPNCFSQMLW